ncbi:hypothetical protein EHF33_14435 [Deinococcus psychrotolerans]|uniref:GTPase-associated system helical domain-containing protein n=1 Tax=Deinococcus psychrotolerans TaxID=2489213 RepID=A0A3G8YFN9_9DEIO|nr:GTPase-associated system all-helical protein GASH [Deinococcus psychrotolerans]AZI44108.1 hypothetical protein EHF33_14435 [Deinococcus psychrotolerans]
MNSSRSTETNLLDDIFTGVMGRIEVNKERLGYLRKAAASLEKAVTQDRRLIVSLALSAFIPEGSLSALTPVREALTAEWETLTSEVKGGGLPYLRAVGILALMQAAQGDPKAGSVLYLALRDPLERQVEGIEADLRARVLRDLRQIYESYAKAIWDGEGVAPRKAVTKVEALKLSLPANAQPALATALSDAASNTLAVVSLSGSYLSITEPTVNEAWAEHFGNEAAKGVTSLFQNTLNLIEGTLGPVLKDAARVAAVSQQAAAATGLAERRLNVMWWMQARYSQPLQRAYRTLTPLTAAVQMAHDLAMIVSVPATDELEAVLIEAWYLANKAGGDAQGSLAEVMQQLADDGVLESAPTSEPQADGRVLLLEAFQAGDTREAVDWDARVGVPGTTQLTPTELAVWMFRNWQIKAFIK